MNMFGVEFERRPNVESVIVRKMVPKVRRLRTTFVVIFGIPSLIIIVLS